MARQCDPNQNKPTNQLPKPQIDLHAGCRDYCHDDAMYSTISPQTGLNLSQGGGGSCTGPPLAKKYEK